MSDEDETKFRVWKKGSIVSLVLISMNNFIN